MKYNYPLIASWTQTFNTYVVRENKDDSNRIDFISVEDPEIVFINDRSKEAFESLIGTSVTVHSPTAGEPSLTITVESSALDRTLETAKELEATLLRVKALMA